MNNFCKKKSKCVHLTNNLNKTWMAMLVATSSDFVIFCIIIYLVYKISYKELISCIANIRNCISTCKILNPHHERTMAKQEIGWQTWIYTVDKLFHFFSCFFFIYFFTLVYYFYLLIGYDSFSDYEIQKNAIMKQVLNI